MTASEPVIVIEPLRRWRGLKVKEIWESKGLLYFFVWRDVKVRYKQTVLGALWAILQPVLTMLIFTFVFSRVAKIPSDGIPYQVFSLTALVPWTFFANGVALAANSIVGNASLVGKVYFPRLVLPTSSIGAGLVDFGLAFAVLLVVMPFYGTAPKWTVIFVPPLLVLAVATTLGVGLWLAALNVYYRDVRYVVPFLIQFWLFATPIAYPASVVTGPARFLLNLNPITGVVEGFRWALLGAGEGVPASIWTSSLSAAVICASGLWYFRRMERAFADAI